MTSFFLLAPFLSAIFFSSALAQSQTLRSPRLAAKAPAAAARAILKPGAPAVDVEAQRIEGGKLQVTFTYYSPKTGKLERVRCFGSLGDIENEVRELGKQERMSRRVQDLVEVALRRMRDLEVPLKN